MERRKRCRRPWAVGMALLVCAPATAMELAGEAFTDPEHRAAVPASWGEQPIRYEQWAEGADLAVTLDQHLYQALLPALTAFAKRERLDIAVREGTCGISAGKLKDRVVDMGGFCCAPGLEDRLPGLRYITLGIGALALIVNRENPIENLSLAQARSLFRGQIYRWDELDDASGALPGFVRPVGRLHCKRRPGHWRLLLDNENLFGPRLIEVNTITDMLGTVSGDSNAIGYEVLWMIEKARARDRIKPLSVNGISPHDRQRLAAGDYPLYRAFHVAIWEAEAAKPQAQRLARYLRQAVKTLDRKYGLIPAGELRAAGWSFKGDELVGGPQ